MRDFHYVAQDDKGRRYTGSVKADSHDLALKALSERFAIVTRLESHSGGSSGGLFSRRIPNEDLLGFCETLSTMLDGGVTLKKALDTLLGDTENPRLRSVLMDVSSQVGTGSALSEAMAQHPQVFDDFFTQMVKAGETSGELPEMIRRVAEYKEKIEDMKDRVKSAMVYPTVVLSFAGLLVLVILAFGVPYLEELYDGLGITLPLSTQVVAAVGHFLSNYFLFFLAFLMGLFLLFRVFARSPQGRRVIDASKLRLPILRDVFQNLYTARFARTLALLYSSGVPLLDALHLTGRSIGNVLVADTVTATQDELKKGGNLSDSLRLNPYFSDSAIGLITAGEDSGNLDVMLKKVAAFYERKVNNRLDAATSIVEPLIMIAVGIIIGGIIMALGLPFLTLASNF